jgi:superfamily II DNA or RNA helicase
MLREGDLVRGTHWPEIVEIKRCEPLPDTSLVLVEALGRISRRYYEHLLESYQLEFVERIGTRETAGVDGPAIGRALQYKALECERQFSRTRALGSQRVLPLPHQIDAVYNRMLQAPQVRFLLADDPGAGKTIMAGMLIRELQARGSADRVLILVPPLVLTQWQDELRSKFGLDFRIITRATVKEAGGRNPFVETPKCLASLYFAARDEIKALVAEADFDLVIVDEAHKMAAYTEGVKTRKTRRTRLYQLGEVVCRRAPHRLLLTATPHKGDTENYRHLLQLVDPDVFRRRDGEQEQELLRDKANPYVIRRLKENMVRFDGTPLFPPRTTITLEFDLSKDELNLYEAVTDYVRHHFNRAMGRGQTRTAFAMMVLQRRLSSSVEAIYQSLSRRRERLQALLVRLEQDPQATPPATDDSGPDDPEDVTAAEEEQLEERAEAETDAVDPEELRLEISELDRLIGWAGALRGGTAERKLVELENTLFGPDGLLAKGEKILIFTEFTDTLRRLQERLQQRVEGIAVITGSLTMEERGRQVELFRNRFPIMIATDAGGESINLQFCNQMVNYDIPWNPNKLEQRMGRIHRIGQRNEVFIFNLVAKNTREGHVLAALLRKMEQMRQDLGRDLVYDFLGDILEEQMGSLADILQDCILERRRLDDVVTDMEAALSNEHRRLLEIAQQERLERDVIDLPGMRREQHLLALRRIPPEACLAFAKSVLTAHKVPVTPTEYGFRVERLPKSIRDKVREAALDGLDTSRTMRADLISDGHSFGADHPVCRLAMALAAEDAARLAVEPVAIYYPTSEPLDVELYEMSIVDGTGRELTREWITVARRPDGRIIQLDPLWIWQCTWERVEPIGDWTAPLLSHAVREAQRRMYELRALREHQLAKKAEFLRRAFDAQYEEVARRLTEAQRLSVDSRNSILVHQAQAQLADIEKRREERLAEVERERSVQLQPPRRLLQARLVPDGSDNTRVIPADYAAQWEQEERLAGRTLVKVMDAFGLADFYSETADGEAKYFRIIQGRREEVNPEAALNASASSTGDSA